MSNIVVYDNKLNLIPFKLSKFENDIFFALLYKVKNQHDKIIELNFSELKQLINFNRDSKEIRAVIKSVARKIASSIVEYETVKTTKFFSIFQILEIPNQDDYYIRAQISEPFRFLFNDLKLNFTIFELAEFSNLNSKYTQTLYRLLKQFKSTGFIKIDWEHFCRILDIPNTYALNDIERRILKPSVKQLSEPKNLFDTLRIPFENLTYKKFKTLGKGNKITSIEFYFLPQHDDEAKLEEQKRSLETISNDIKRTEAVKSFKRSFSSKDTTKEEKTQINPLTGSVMMWYDSYINLSFYVANKFEGGYDTCKILSIEDRGIIILLSKNQETGKIFKQHFENKAHFENWFRGVKI